MMNADLLNWFKKNKLWVALIAVVIFGYQFGKDLAISDNEEDRIAREAQTEAVAP